MRPSCGFRRITCAKSVAHEVGHVLGLRHNFAGSLATTSIRRNLDDWFRDYVAGKAAGRLHQQDHLRLRHGLQRPEIRRVHRLAHAHGQGGRCRTTGPPLTGVILTVPEAREKKLLFGTDEDTIRYGDVRRFDYGADPVVGAYARSPEIIDLLPNDVD